MTVSIMIVAVLFACFCVVLPGWGVKQILLSRGFHFRGDALSNVLSSFSLGVHVNALLFLICWVFAAPTHPLLLAAILITVNISITVIGHFFAQDTRAVFDGPTRLMLVAGGLIGLFAAVRFPSSLDSVQVLQVQNFLLGRAGGQMIVDGAFLRFESFLFGGLEVPTQSGFAGLMLIPSLLQTSMPVATIAAGNKILLLVLASIVSLYVARQFNIKFLLLGAALILLNMILSRFGLYGLFSTGKDSIFAMIMALASLSAAIDAKEDTNEPGLYLSAAILLGAIAVPYLIVFWALYFLLSGGQLLRQVGRLAAWCIYPLTLGVIGVRSAFAEPGAFSFGLLPALAAGVLLVWIVNFTGVRLRAYKFEFSDQLKTATAFLPLLCIVGIWLVMPVTGKIVIGYNEAGPITQAFAPLDGKMSASDFLLSMYPMNNWWISIAVVLLSALTPLVSTSFRTPFYVAFFSFLPATTLFALLNVKLNIPLLPHFNLWDITRDTVQWCLGVFGIVLVFCGIKAVNERLNTTKISPVMICGVLFLVGVYTSLNEYRNALALAPTITQSGGFAGPLSAIAMDIVWREGRNSNVFVSRDSDFAQDYYSYQMFGPAQIEQFNPAKIPLGPEQLYFASSRDLKLLLKLSKDRKSSGFARAFSDEGYVVKLIDDGKAEFDDAFVPALVSKLTEAYDVEIAGERNFRWVRQQSQLTLIEYKNSDRTLCVTLGFINAWADKDLRIRLQGSDSNVEVTVPPESNLSNPTEVKVCPSIDDYGVAKLDILSNAPARKFSGDAREISYGITWPVK